MCIGAGEALQGTILLAAPAGSFGDGQTRGCDYTVAAFSGDIAWQP